MLQNGETSTAKVHVLHRAWSSAASEDGKTEVTLELNSRLSNSHPFKSFPTRVCIYGIWSNSDQSKENHNLLLQPAGWLTSNHQIVLLFSLFEL